MIFERVDTEPWEKSLAGGKQSLKESNSNIIALESWATANISISNLEELSVVPAQ